MFVAILRTTDLNPRVVHLKGGQELAHITRLNSELLNFLRFLIVAITFSFYDVLQGLKDIRAFGNSHTSLKI